MTSKKSIEVFDHSTVNFLVGFTLLILSINDFNLFSPCSHKKNVSSMYLHHKYGLYSDHFIFSYSSSAINKTLYGGTNFVPIAVPRFCLNVSFQNVNMLFFNTTSVKSIMVSDEVSSLFLNADRFFWCGNEHFFFLLGRIPPYLQGFPQSFWRSGRAVHTWWGHQAR